MMEHLFIHYPSECLGWSKRNLKISLVTGCGLMSFHIIALFKSWKKWENKNIYDKILWVWVFSRIVIYFLQLPVRYRIAKRVWQAHRQNRVSQQRQMALAMLRTWEWTVVQWYSRVLLGWVGLTILLTWWFGPVFRDQAHRMSVLKCCCTSVLLLCLQTAISVQWLKRLLDEGWVDNTSISLHDFRKSSNRFRSLTELRKLLYSRQYPFDCLPIDANPETQHEDPMSNIQVYLPTNCAICKSRFPVFITSSESSNDVASGYVEQTPQSGVADIGAAPSPASILEQVTLLPCGHIFHSECIEAWLNMRHSKCPYCNVSTLSDRVWVTLKGTESQHRAKKEAGL